MLRRSVIYLILMLFAVRPSAAADDSMDRSSDPLRSVRTSLRDQAFVVETTDEDADEALNRVAGDIDLGFSAPQYTYDSVSHAATGALQRSTYQDQHGDS